MDHIDTNKREPINLKHAQIMNKEITNDKSNIQYGNQYVINNHRKPIVLPSFNIKDINSKKRIQSVDLQRSSILNTIKRKSSLIDYLSDKSLAEENLLKAVLFILNKPHRSINENQIIFTFLLSLSALRQIMEGSMSENNYEELLKNISFVMKYEGILTGKIFLRYGDKGEKFYILLKGKVAILIPKDEKMDLSEEEYCLYLLNLRKYGEVELMSKCVNQNKGVFKFEEDDFDLWILRAMDKIEEEFSPTRAVGSGGGSKSSSILEISSNSSAKPNLKNTKKKSQAVSPENKTNRQKSERLIMMLKEEIRETYNKINSPSEDETITVNDYINRILPQKRDYSFYSFNFGLNERKSVNIWLYNHVLSLSDGQKFGDYALDSSNQKRMASIISLENTHLGVLNKESYEDCIKDVNEKVKKLSSNFLLSLPIYKNLNPSLFLKNFFHLFVLRKVNWHEKLFVEGKEPESVFIIKEGEFELNTKISNKEINHLVKDFCNGDESHISESETDEYLTDEKVFSKFMNQKKVAKISIVKNTDILGLSDSIHRGKYIYSAECVSAQAEVFEIKNKFFEMISKSDEEIGKNLEKILNKKIEYVVQRLISTKKMRIKFYKSFHSNEIVDKETKNFTNFTNKPLLKRITISKNIKDKLSDSSINTYRNKEIKTERVKNSEIIKIKEDEKGNTHISLSPYLEHNMTSIPIETKTIKELPQITCRQNAVNNSCETVNMHSNIEKLTRNFNHTPIKKYNKQLFDKVFESYLEAEGKLERYTVKNRNNSKDKPINPQINIMKDAETNTSLSHRDRYKSKSTNVSNCFSKFSPKKSPVKGHNKSQSIKNEDIKSNHVDCLIMDNFNRIYSTVYHYSNLFQPDNINKEGHNLKLQELYGNNLLNNSDYKPVKLLFPGEIKELKEKGVKLRFVNTKNKIFETSRSLVSDRARMIYKKSTK